MPKFRFTGSAERDFLYPTARRVEPGDVVEADENPDEAWFEPVTSTPAANSPAATDEPLLAPAALSEKE